MDLRKEVERAIENAPLLLPNGNVSRNALARYKDLPDDADVVYPPFETDDPHHATVDADDIESFRKLLGAYADITGKSISENYVQYCLHHEIQHIVAARKIGAKSVRLGVMVQRTALVKDVDSYGHYFLNPFMTTTDFTTTKFKAALIVAQPYDLSEGDRYDLKHGYGYTVTKLGEMAAALNSKAGQPIYPVPFSYG